MSELTPEQSKQLASMLRRQQKLLRRREREQRNSRRLLQRLQKAAAANGSPPVLNPHERLLLKKLADEMEIDDNGVMLVRLTEKGCGRSMSGTAVGQ